MARQDRWYRKRADATPTAEKVARDQRGWDPLDYIRNGVLILLLGALGAAFFAAMFRGQIWVLVLSITGFIGFTLWRPASSRKASGSAAAGPEGGEA